MIYFDKCKITINGTGLASDSASLDSQNDLLPTYIVGGKGVVNNSPNGEIKNTFKINYYPLLQSECNLHLISGLKVFNSGQWTPVTIVIAGITGYNCYLENFNLKAAPNELVLASVSFTSFVPVSGSISTGITSLDPSSLAYGWATYIASGANYLTVPTYDFNYTFNANWQPTYIIGYQSPNQVELLNCQEQINLERDAFYNATFSGVDACSQFMHCSLDGKDIQIKNLSLVCESEGFGSASAGLNTVYFTITGASITNTNLNAKIDDIIRVQTTINKYY